MREGDWPTPIICSPYSPYKADDDDEHDDSDGSENSMKTMMSRWKLKPALKLVVVF